MGASDSLVGEAIDPGRPVEIAERVWWVGHYQPGDPFQCHVYLIEHGDQSILFDPGSALTFRHTLRKIEAVTPFSNIRYFVCHHQDPDIAAALPLVDQLVSRDDAVVVTHWRAEALLKHYGLSLPFWLVDRNGWRLDLGGRRLRFIFTPYAHFPGAFCTHDEQTGTLFSSDLFGGFTEGFSLYARDESYFEALRPFHEHYMPSREILDHALTRLQEVPIRRIAPQHGSIIPEHLVAFMLEKLKTLDCGLYLLAGGDSDVQRLSQLNTALRDIPRAMTRYRDFRDIAAAMLGIARRFLPAVSMEFYARVEDGRALHLAPASCYRGALVEPPPEVMAVLGLDRKAWSGLRRGSCHPLDCDCDRDCGCGGRPLLIPLFAPSAGVVESVAIVRLDGELPDDERIGEMAEQMSVPLQVAVEREAIYHMLDFERQEFFERSIRDPLTGLFTRLYMQDAVGRQMRIHDRDANAAIGLALFDIDHFKRVNDTWGHNAGDVVLRGVAAALRDTVREADLPVRLGGEEFAVFVLGESARHVAAMAERARRAVEQLRFGGELAEQHVTLSVGVANRRSGEALETLIGRADRALYEAKSSGRNRVCADPSG
ncbi:MAG: diguanylate cyclase [Gammaproteobacteria bacterium]|nr:diguanylate cyclase [Gammaproteobacteria bacterium]